MTVPSNLTVRVDTLGTVVLQWDINFQLGHGEARSDTRRRRGMMTQGKGRVARMSVGSAAGGALAVGAVAFGAAAIGALAVGVMTVRRLRVVEARIESLSIGTLTVDHLDVRSTVEGSFVKEGALGAEDHQV
ncbi:hypothetical protein [Deinococcus sp. UYEF24]